MGKSKVSRLFCAGCTAAFLMAASRGEAGPTSGRGMAVDGQLPQAITFCDIGSACSPTNFGGIYDNSQNTSIPQTPVSLGAFNDVYVYNDGVISIGAPLPTTASVSGGLSTFGSNYLAPGFFNYSTSADITPTASIFPPSGGQQTAEIYWTFYTNVPPPNLNSSVTPTLPELAIFGMILTSQPDGTITVDMEYGAQWTPDDSATWFDPINPYCDHYCDSSDNGSPFNGDPVNYPSGTAGFITIAGNYLPAGTVIGSAYSSFPGSAITISGDCAANPTSCSDFFGLGSTFDVTPTAVPEPAAWILMLGGIGAVGSLLRRTRERAPSATLAIN